MLTRLGFLFLAVLIGVPLALPQTKQNTDLERRLWSGIKQELISKDGEKYFKDHMLDTRLPILRGTIVSADSLENPEVIVLAMSDRTTVEVTLQIAEPVPPHGDWRAAPLRRRVAVGDEIEFMGVGAAFTKEPFMLTFYVQVEDVTHLPR